MTNLKCPTCFYKEIYPHPMPPKGSNVLAKFRCPGCGVVTYFIVDQVRANPLTKKEFDAQFEILSGYPIPRDKSMVEA